MTDDDWVTGILLGVGTAALVLMFILIGFFIGLVLRI